MRRLVVGDIHGCYEEFLELLDRAALSAEDEVIALGDVVDRGPDTPAVLRYFMEQAGARSLMGNHERKHVRALRGQVRPAPSQLIARAQIGETDYPAACAFMEGLPSHLELPEAVLIHGFLEPHVPLREQRGNMLVGIISAERELAERFERPWYEYYEGDVPLICGHLNYLQSGEPLVHGDRVLGIDTGCCRGGALTGVILPDLEIIQVRSRGNHWRQALLWWNEELLERKLRLPLTALTWEDLENLAPVAEQRADGNPRMREHAARLRALATEAAAAAEALHQHVEAAHRGHWEALGGDAALAALPEGEQGSLYAARLKGEPLARLLHLARKGRLTREAVRSRQTPAQLVELCRSLGIMPVAGAWEEEGDEGAG